MWLLHLLVIGFLVKNSIYYIVLVWLLKIYDARQRTAALFIDCLFC